MKWFLLFSLLFTTNSFSQESNEIYIKLGEARTKKSLLAFPALQSLSSPKTSSSKEVSLGTDLFSVIKNDLEVSTYFQFIDKTAFLEDTANKGLRPAPQDANGFSFSSWQQIGAEFLIRGGYSVVGDNLNLEIYLYHVPKASLVFGKKYNTKAASVRKLAHTFSNDVLEALTGKSGMYLSRVVVSSDRGVFPSKEIFVMDWDGANAERISNHRGLSISPAWSPDLKKIAYTSYVARGRNKIRNADMFLYDLTAGKAQLISYRQGINSGASFAPDGSIYLTISQGSTPDIFKINQGGDILNKITNGPAGAMNVEPAVSFDGRKIAFSSDRPGRTMIYTMNSDGSNVKRITMAGQFNASPSWSPDGKKIAFAGQSQTGPNFDIYVVDADGTNMVRLTKANRPNGKPANNEDPTWSPDGRFVMYTSDRTGKNQIYFSTPDGLEERRVTLDNHNYFKPKWSRNP